MKLFIGFYFEPKTPKVPIIRGLKLFGTDFYTDIYLFITLSGSAALPSHSISR